MDVAGEAGEQGRWGEQVQYSHVLLFASVGTSPLAKKLVVRNVNHLRNTKGLSADVYLVHYRSDQLAWKSALGGWYDENVQFSVERPGLKFWLAKDLLISKAEPGLPSVDIDSYDFLWMLDEDAHFFHTNLGRMFSLAQASGAGIMTPAFTTVLAENAQVGELAKDRPIVPAVSPGTAAMERITSAPSSGTACQRGDELCEFQAPQPGCEFRYTNFVEVPFVLMKPKAFRAVVGDCRDCLASRKSTWGLNRVWCGYIGKTQSWSSENSCAILDATPIMHMNTRAHPKYRNYFQGGRWEQQQVLEQVHRTFPNFYVEGLKTYRCVK